MLFFHKKRGKLQGERYKGEGESKILYPGVVKIRFFIASKVDPIFILPYEKQ
ncbi:hypothetical protein BGP_3030 [Beggiatoa sp. PS]|nr:hypothetical protein BGP_3030 [Beggiatoa sp. PS]